MELNRELANRQIIEVLSDEPEIGVILERYGIGCVKCSIGTCLLKDVVAVHFLGDEIEARIEQEINAYLDGLPAGKKETPVPVEVRL